MKKITITSIIVFISMLLGSQLAFASNAILSVSPSASTSTVGSVINAIIKIEPTGNNVCVVKGTINFAGLSCQSVTVANGVMAQTVPTCAEPNFTIGIPKCASSTQNLLSVSVKGTQVGQGVISFSGVKVIGAGSDVVSNSLSGNYNIVAVVQSIPEKVEQPKQNNPIKVNAIPDTGLQVPSGVGQFSSTNTVEQIVSTTSTLAVPVAEKKNNLIATAYESISNISDKTINVLLLIIIAIMAGWIVYLKRSLNISSNL